jgi:branched-chain amino acid transport system ATP-binding protein
MTTILKADDLYKDFSGLQVLTGISLEILQGERHAVIGPNGSGKTTLFNIITGLYRPSRGHIYFFDKDISGWPAHRIARLGVSRSFQIINVFPKMTVYENVRSAVASRFIRGFGWLSSLSRNRKIMEETDQIIELLSLDEQRDTAAFELSYGKQRHLELALTMARDPVLIMLDEPTAGLNSEDTWDAIRLIRELTEGKTLIMVEHDMDVVFNLADRVTVLGYGQILATGTPDEIQAHEEVQKAYLGRK